LTSEKQVLGKIEVTDRKRNPGYKKTKCGRGKKKKTLEIRNKKK